MALTPKDVACEWLMLAWNVGSDAAIDRLMVSSALCHGLPTTDGRPILGPDEFRTFSRRFRLAFPDLSLLIVKTVTEGEYIAVHCRITGTHLGPGLDIPPTKKPVKFAGMAIAQVMNGRIVEVWNSFDFLALYRQIGVMAPDAGVRTAPCPAIATRA